MSPSMYPAPGPAGKSMLRGRSASHLGAPNLARVPMCPAPPAMETNTRLSSNSAASTSQTTVSSAPSLLPRHSAKKLSGLFKSQRQQLERRRPAVQAVSERVGVVTGESWDLNTDLHILRKRLELLSTQDGDTSDSDSEDEEDCMTTSLSLPSVSIKESLELTPRNYQATGRVLMCTGKKCLGGAAAYGAASTLAAGSNVEVKAVKCVGRCGSGGCAMKVKVDGQACASYDGFGVSAVATILDSHFIGVPELEPVEFDSHVCCPDCA